MGTAVVGLLMVMTLTVAPHAVGQPELLSLLQAMAVVGALPAAVTAGVLVDKVFQRRPAGHPGVISRAQALLGAAMLSGTIITCYLLLRAYTHTTCPHPDGLCALAYAWLVPVCWVVGPATAAAWAYLLHRSW